MIQWVGRQLVRGALNEHNTTWKGQEVPKPAWGNAVETGAVRARWFEGTVPLAPWL